MSEFTDYLHEVFNQFGSIQARRMFGGYGIYHEGLMFALVADEVLYLKADEALARQFKAKGLPQFEYRKGNKMIKVSYYAAPADALEDAEEMARWAHAAYQVARHGKTE